jgi:3-phosphoshikimate 1-carboxyvinyltransferase
LVVAALAEGESVLSGALDSEDTRVMIDSLSRLGIELVHCVAASVVRVAGRGGRIPAASADLFLANSGTSMRFLAAAVAIGQGCYRLDGVPRMRERPMGDLLDSLRALGVDAESELGTGCPPVVIRSRGLRGGTARVPGSVSSQFASALLLAAPYADQTVTLDVEGELVSAPFLDMTVRVMADFGVRVERPAAERLVVPAGQRYHGREYAIEPDATAASYFFAAAALTGGRVTVEGLEATSLQGDLAFVELVERMGATVIRQPGSTTVVGGPLHGIDADLRAISDTTMTLAVLAAFADGPTTICGVEHIRRQETDRVRAIATELQRLGVQVEERADGLRIEPAPLRGAVIETYGDHRMAMSFALAGLRLPGVVICNPACTAKTYPRFFHDLGSLLR